MMDAITYPYRDLSPSTLVKRVPESGGRRESIWLDHHLASIWGREPKVPLPEIRTPVTCMASDSLMEGLHETVKETHSREISRAAVIIQFSYHNGSKQPM